MVKCRLCKKQVSKLPKHGLCPACAENGRIAYICKKHGILNPDEVKQMIDQQKKEEKTKKEKQKHEKIEQKAWELYQKMQLLTDELFFKDSENKDTRFKDFVSEDNLTMMKIAWLRAEKFYEFAKEKEREENDAQDLL